MYNFTTSALLKTLLLSGLMTISQLSFSNGTKIKNSSEFEAALTGTYTLVNFCNGEEIVLPDGSVADEPGVYLIDNGTSCQDTIELEMFPITPDLITNQTVCEGEALQGPSNVVALDANGCEYNLILNLTVTPAAPNEYTAAQICEGETYNWNGQSYSESGEYLIQATDNHGCTYLQELELDVLPLVECNSSQNSYTEITICPGDITILPDGSTAGQPGIYLVENATTTPDTFEISLFPVADDVYVQEISCSGDIPPSPFPTSSGTYTSVAYDDNGCSYILTTEIIISDPQNEYTIIEICEGESFEWNGEVYSETDEYLLQAYNEYDCPFVTILELTVIPAIDCLTSTAEYAQLALSLFPNPATETITVSGNFEGEKKQMLAYIYDLQGQLIKTTTLTNNFNVPINDLEVGLYLMSIELDGTIQVPLMFTKQ